MTREERTCLACGRPLTGRQRKWCKRPDCGGGESIHPRVIKTCECGESFETYEGYHEKCPKCRGTRPTMVTRTCIQCGKQFSRPGWTDPNWIWCNGFCYDRYMQDNPQPDYFARDRELSKNGLCFGCGKELDLDHRRYGFCSAQCDAIYQVRNHYREEEQRERVLAEGGPELAKVFNYVRTSQWFDLHPRHGKRWGYDREYGREYMLAHSRESVRMATRRKLGLPEDAPLPDGTPTTTELPIKLWLEQHKIEFERQCYIQVGGTFTLVDFFIPLPSTDTGICLYCDGDYWHGPDFPDTRKKDLMQVRELEKLGHIVIRLGEKDIQKGVRPLRVLALYADKD